MILNPLPPQKIRDKKPQKKHKPEYIFHALALLAATERIKLSAYVSKSDYNKPSVT